MEFIQEIKNETKFYSILVKFAFGLGLYFGTLENLSVENLRHKRMVQTF
jgi:hypothetical protein